MREGWEPPDTVTKEQYVEIKKRKNPDDPLTAFVGFGCSFGGKWFGGFASGMKKGGYRSYAAESKNALLRKMQRCRDVEFKACSYHLLKIKERSVIYCDPPFEGTTSYGRHSYFNSNMFYDWCKRLHKEGHIVVLSEYNAPDYFKCVKTFLYRTSVSLRNYDDRLEKLYRLM